MALVTVQRSPCGSSSTSNNLQCQTADDDTDGAENEQSENASDLKSVSECYFAVKGAALVLPHDECLHVYRKPISSGASDIQQHLQAMLYLLHAEDTLKMAVKLESIHNGRTRYLVVVSQTGKQQTEESCLLGIDCNKQTTIGLVLPLWADTRITLDGDGGFSVTSSGRHHIFKPVSVQAMWSALQTLHKASSKARQCNYFKAGGTHQWIEYYESRINSDRSCLNEWHAMDDLESRRPPSPDTIRSQPTEREETEKHIRAKLKELMMSVDLDEVTSKYIRTRLEEILDINLKEFKSFIDQEMLTILGQMDAPTEIFQYLYLGSEWNASNLEELVVNGIGHILNVTREIDNFFPGMFDYQNVRVYDEESTEILHYWDKTYRYIRKAKDEGSKVLVHCKMGISRSASVVIAYVMKAYDWNLQQALDFVKNKRNCIKPNSGFLKQLEIYQGILDASKHRHNSLWRSKSETNLESHDKPKKEKSKTKGGGLPAKSESLRHLQVPGTTCRPKSWSPSDSVADMLFPPNGSMSSEALSKSMFCDSDTNHKELRDARSFSVSSPGKQTSDSVFLKKESSESDKNHHLQVDSTIPRVSSIKDRINELESHVNSNAPDSKQSRTEAKSPSSQNRSGLVLNLATQFESVSKPSSPTDDGLVMKPASEEIVEPVLSQTKPAALKHQAVLVKPSLWPEEGSVKTCLTNNGSNSNASNSSPQDVTLIKPSVSKQLGFHSAVSCCGKKQAENMKDGISALSKPVPAVMNVFDKTSHETCESAFKPVPAKSVSLSFTEEKTSCPQQQPVQSAGSLKGCTLDYKLDSISGHTISKLQVNCKVQEKLPVSCSRGQLSPPTPESPTCVKKINSLPSDGFPIKTQKTYCDPFQETHHSEPNCLPRTNFIYDKEEIPFTPGTVQRTKKQLEEKSLTRTMSFDSGFPLRYDTVPSTLISLEPPWGKPVRRSRSLRSEHRPASMFSGKYYPLPALASPLPKTFKTLDERFPTSAPHHNIMLNSVHSASTPSVVEAVNRVICGTQKVISSAIQSLPTSRNVVSLSSCCTSTDSNIEFGSASSLPDIDVEDVIFTSKSTAVVQNDNPVFGVVRQQREKLESKVPKNQIDKIENRNRRNECGTVAETCGLVLEEETFKADDSKDIGIVKRLTKELEAKSTSESIRKEKSQSLGENEMSKKEKCLYSTSCPEATSNSLSSSDFGLGPRQPTGLRSSLPTSVEKKLSCNNSSANMTVAPPTPHRKTSLDLNFLRKPSRFSIASRIRNQTKSDSSKESEKPVEDSAQRGGLKCGAGILRTSQPATDFHVVQADVKTCGRPPPAVKISSSLGGPDIPSPPPPPPPSEPLRKIMRKQQGSTHPLSRLANRQRHMNPLYNTM